jgi:hypothetical protein
VLLAATVATGLLAAVWSDDPMGVVVDVWWPIVLGVLIGGSVWWMAAKGRVPVIPTIPPGDSWLIIERWFSRVDHWVMSVGHQVLPRWRAAGLAVAGHLLQVCAWQKALEAGERSLQRWSIAVTLLLLLGVAIALLST